MVQIVQTRTKKRGEDTRAYRSAAPPPRRWLNSLRKRLNIASQRLIATLDRGTISNRMTDTTEEAMRPEQQVSSTSDVLVEEPPLPRRTRRPIDSLRLIIVVVSMGALVALAIVAENTLSALRLDLRQIRPHVPDGVIDLVGGVATVSTQLLTPLIVVLLMVRGRVRTTIEVLAAGVLASLATALTSWWLRNDAPDRLQESFLPPFNPEADPVPALPALIVAVLTVISRHNMARIRQIAWFAVVATFAIALFDNRVTVAGIFTSVAIGRIVGLLVRIVAGQPSVAPDGHTVAQTLRRNGYNVTKLRSDPVDQYRRYIAETAGDGQLGVLVLDRDSEGAGALARTLDRIRTREEVLPRRAVTMRTAVDQITLQSLAAARAGARTPHLRSVLRISDDATVIVYDHVPGAALSNVDGDDISDDMLKDLWQQLARLRQNQVAHRRLSGRTILVGDSGKIWLLDPSGGEVGAPDLAIRTDLAQAMVGAALVVGPQRTVQTAVEVLGEDVVGAAIPLLQPIALAGWTRQSLKGRREILSELRDAIVNYGGTEPEQPVQLQRVRPISLLTGVGAVAAVYLVGTQLSDLDPSELWDQLNPVWLLLAGVAVFGSYIGAAMAVLGFVPEHVPFWRTVSAQVALSFVRLVAPTTVGNVAINIRLLTKAGISGPLAAASIAANQVGQVAVTLPLIIVLGVVTGSNTLPDLNVSPAVLLIVAGLVLAAALLLFVPSIRHRLSKLWRDFAERGLPRLLDVVSSPRQLLEAVGGVLLQASSFVICFYACLRAVGVDNIDIASLAVVQMVGNTLGMAVPTPGGLGAVEAALTAGVTTLGIGATTAVTGVLVFRIVTFWLPIIPGWFLWTQMQKRDLL